jgi:hypothetical protein
VGYNGFWLHHVLTANGIDNHVLDAASLPITAGRAGSTH